MVYIIIEIQKSNNGTVAIVPPVSYTNQAQARAICDVCNILR